MHWDSIKLLRAGLSGVVEGLGRHWDSPWLKKERPSGAAWAGSGSGSSRPHC